MILHPTAPTRDGRRMAGRPGQSDGYAVHCLLAGAVQTRLVERVPKRVGVFRLYQARPPDAVRPDGVRRRVSRDGYATTAGRSTVRTRTRLERDVRLPVRLTLGDGRLSVPHPSTDYSCGSTTARPQ